MPVQGDGVLLGDVADLLFPDEDARPPLLEGLAVLRARTENEPAHPAIDDGLLAVLGQVGSPSKPHHGGDVQGAGEDRPVGRARAQVRGDAQDVLRVQVDREAWREVARHHDDTALLPGQVRGVMVPQETVEDPDHEVLKVVEPVQDHGLGRATPHGLELEHAPLEGALCREMVLFDVADGSRHHRRVVQHEELGIEDAGLDGSKLGLGHCLDLPDPLLGPDTGLVEPVDLFGDLIRRDRLVGHHRNTPVEKEHLSGGDPLGGRRSVQNTRQGCYASSKPRPTRSQRAFRA